MKYYVIAAVIVAASFAFSMITTKRKMKFWKFDLASVDGSKERFETRVVHAGSEPEINNWAVVTPVSLATTFIQVAHFH